MSAIADPTRRFSGRVDDYVRGRPGYPEELFDALLDLTGVGPGALAADIGAGTGAAAEPLLRRGLAVVAVEPNEEMRRACRTRFADSDRLTVVDGRAEATGLATASVDLVLAAQAFHWFDVDAARDELARILRPGGSAALVWNARRAGGTPFAEGYEGLLLRHGIDYRQVGHRGVSDEKLTRFFRGGYRRLRFVNAQRLDRAGLRARLLSSSYVPAAGAPGHEAMLAELDALFDDQSAGETVTLDYDVDLFFGRLRAD